MTAVGKLKRARYLVENRQFLTDTAAHGERRRSVTNSRGRHEGSRMRKKETTGPGAYTTNTDVTWSSLLHVTTAV